MLLEQAGTQSDGTPLGELDGVAGVVEQGLPQPGRVAAQPKWDAARVDFDGQALGTGLIADHRANVVDHRPQREVGLFQFEFAGLDLGDVEDVVDHRQEVTGRTVDLAQSFGLLGPWLAAAQQMRETDDGVHRRADFVAHVGQETAFRQVGGFCCGFGCRQFGGARGHQFLEMVAVIAKRLLGMQSFQLSCRSYADLFQSGLCQMAVRQRGTPDHGNQSNRLAGMAPQGDADVTFRAKVLEHPVTREQLADVGRETANLLAGDITTGGILQGIGDVVLELSVTPDGQCPGAQSVAFEAIDAHVEHVEALGDVTRQDGKERLLGWRATGSCQESLYLLRSVQRFLGEFAFGDVQERDDELIRPVLIGHTIVPAPVGLQILLEAYRFPGPGDMVIGSDPVKGVVFDPRKSLPNGHAARVDASQLQVGRIGVEEAIINRLARCVMEHFMVRHADRTLREKGLELPLHLSQCRFALPQGGQQAVEAADELADFILAGDWQGLQGLAAVRHRGQPVHGGNDRR